MERIGYTVWAVGYAAAILLCVVLIMLVVTGCSKRIRAAEPEWCLTGETRDGEVLRLCSETRGTCREVHTLASHYGRKHLKAVTRCERQ